METQQSRWSTIAFTAPAVILMFILLVYPTLDTIRLSFMDRNANEFVGLENYQYVLSSPRMQEAIGNNLLWLVVFTTGTVVLGLLIATLADKVRYEALAKSVIFLPMAISFVGAGVIWKFVYDLNPPGTPLQPNGQIGLLNAIVTTLGPDENLGDAIADLNNEGVPIERQAVVEAIIARETEAITAAVEAGELPQENANALLADLPDAVNNFIAGRLPPQDQPWQALGQWPRIAVQMINDALAQLPEGGGRTLCEVIPYSCVYAIEDVEEEALEQAVEAGTLDADLAAERTGQIEGAALAYVTEGTRPNGEGWQTVDQWDSIIATTRELNIRELNNALETGAEPIDWIRQPVINNFALIIVGIWIWTGFCMVVLSAALKNIPSDLYEAGRVDGASELQLFFRITIPLLMPTLTVVTTTMIITVLKVFDIVYVMTAGNFGTEVIANRMYQEMYSGNREFGHASAIAVVLMLAIVPIMIFNINQFRRQEAQR